MAFEEHLIAITAPDVQLRRYSVSSPDHRWQVLRTDSKQDQFCVAMRSVIDRHGEIDSIIVAGSQGRLFPVDVRLSSIDAVRLLQSGRSDTYLLVVDSYGPTYSASASSALMVYELDSQDMCADELLVICGPEEHLSARTFAYSVCVEDGPVIEATVSVTDSLDPKQGVWIERAAVGRVVILEETMALLRVRIAERQGQSGVGWGKNGGGCACP